MDCCSHPKRIPNCWDVLLVLCIPQTMRGYNQITGDHKEPYPRNNNSINITYIYIYTVYMHIIPWYPISWLFVDICCWSMSFTIANLVESKPSKSFRDGQMSSLHTSSNQMQRSSLVVRSIRSRPGGPAGLGPGRGSTETWRQVFFRLANAALFII